jgi:murein DD-endopeptidase MepM/ murein hydrolase activator NlpD
MSCSGGGDSIAPGAAWAPNSDNYTSSTYQQSGECSEGYLARAGNAEQNMDGGPVPENKITNVSLPVGTDMSMNVQMTLSNSSSPAASWTNGTTIPGVTFNTATGQFSGTVTLPGQYSTTVTALASDGSTIDSKSYLVVAQKTAAGEAITFIHPLPGSVVTARCTASVDGTQIWSDPKRGRPHKGIDLAYPGGKIGNVRAAASGQVIRADGSDANGYGNVVFIGHTNASGQKICITVYAHLASIAVTVGQNVSAGDIVGVEGNTGGSFGPHLHFEIRSPEFSSGTGSNQNAAVYDPAAYITGQMQFDDVTGRTALNNNQDPDPSQANAANVTTQTNSSAVGITPSMANNHCSGYTPDSTNAGPGTGTPQAATPAATGQCFTDAMNFVMTAEVGSWFNPNDTATQQGLIDTPQDRKKCGWVVDTGGNTKFGIAQNGNPGVNVTTLTLAQAESIYQNKYWNATGCNQLPNPLCIVHFNAAVNNGPGRASQFLETATNTSSSSAAISAAAGYSAQQAQTAAAAYMNAQQNFYNDLANGNPSKYGKYLNGWTNRMASLKTYVASSSAASGSATA